MTHVISILYWIGFWIAAGVSYSKAPILLDAFIHGLCSWGYIAYIYNLQHHIL